MKRVRRNAQAIPSEPSPRDLRRSEALYRTLAANLPDTSVFLLDRDLTVLVAEGDAVGRLPWVGDDMFMGRRVTDLHAEIPREVMSMSISNYAAALEGRHGEFEFTSGGLTFVVTATPVQDAEEGIDSVLVVARDVTKRRQDAESLERHARRQHAVACLGQIALRDRDLDELMREAIRTMAEALEVPFSAVLEHDAQRAEFRRRAGVGFRAARGPLVDGHDSQAGYTFRAGEPVIVEDLERETRFSPSKVLLEHGVVSCVSVVIEGRDRPYGVLGAYASERRDFPIDDINFLTTVANVLSAAVERHQDEQASRHAALHDPLTGLPNRVLALDRLQHGLDRRRRDGTEVAVLVVDLDRFKLINDSLGHHAGDQLLLDLAPRLRKAVRSDDTVARLGGDEFAVICDGLSEVHDVITVAEHVASAVRRSFVLGSGEHFMTASIGIALATRATDTPESLLRDADVAMYRAKALGNGRYELFDDEMRAQVVDRLRTETELRRALDRGELRLYYQPIVDVETRGVKAMEALVRWQHPRLGLVPPSSFISVAEETGLAGELGRRVLEQACRQTADWQQRFGLPLEICVNVSARQIMDPLLGAEVAEIARSSGLLPNTLVLEITERMLMDEAHAPTNVLGSLREHGLKLMLDDFGTGYSSLGYLKRFKVDGLKIDQTFVDGLGADAGDSAIVEAIVRMAQALGLEVVAEGVESETQLNCLAELGCQSAQGFLFAKPALAGVITKSLTHVGRTLRSGAG